MNNMEKDFVPYEVALRLKAIGFAESCCFGYWEIVEKERIRINGYSIGNWNNHPNRASAPLYQQAFRWFREKYGLWFRPDYYDEMKEYNFQGSIHELGKYSAVADIGNHKTPEEVELACLGKLLEIVESKSE